MIDCPRCHTTNTSDSRYCRHCGQSFAQAEPEDSPRQSSELPPIPDGGLAQAMPEWLRTPLASTDATISRLPQQANQPEAALPATQTTPTEPDPIDPRSFLTEADLPPWLRQLAVTKNQPTSHSAPAMPWDQTWFSVSSREHVRLAAPRPSSTDPEWNSADRGGKPSSLAIEDGLDDGRKVAPANDVKAPANGLANKDAPVEGSGALEPAVQQTSRPHLLLLIIVVLVVLAIGIVVILASAGRL